jgi:hypothetical protein
MTHRMNWCCIQKLCTSRGEGEEYRSYCYRPLMVPLTLSTVTATEHLMLWQRKMSVAVEITISPPPP